MRLLVLCFFLFIKGYGLDVPSKLTIITLVSPAKSNPRTILLELSQFSLTKNIPNFAQIPKIISFDGLRNPADKPTYDAYKKKVAALTRSHPHFQNTQLLFCKEWGHYAGSLREALKLVKTEYVFIHQDDLQHLQPLDLEGMLEAMDKNHNIKFVRFNNEINIQGRSNTCDRYVDDYIEGGSTFPLMRTSGWGDHDQISRTDYYVEEIFPFIGDVKMFPDGVMMGQAAGDFEKGNHLRWGTYLYGGYGAGPFIRHLDRKSTVW